jgi:hypothetical protein
MNFAYVCNVDGKEYRQGLGATKKEAKTNAAKNAFNIILGFDEEEEVDNVDGKISFKFENCMLTFTMYFKSEPLVSLNDRKEELR